MAKISVAEHIVAALAEAGVERIYGVVGDSLNSLTEAVRQHPSISWVGVRHEEAGAFAAAAEAQLNGRLAVCFGSSGPGCLHLINGLYDAQRSHAPVLAIAAHIPSTEIGTNYFQEFHPERVFADCSHYCELISSQKQMPRTLQIAMQEAVTNRGVSVVVLPGDVAEQTMDDSHLAHPIAIEQPTIQPCDPSMNELAGVLNASRRVTILAGAGCENARTELIQVADLLQAPVVHTLRGKEHVEFENMFDVGMTGLLGFASGHHAMQRCDTLLMLGTDFPYKDWYPEGKTIIQVDSRGNHLGRRCKLDHGFVGDIKATLRSLLSRLERNPDGAHLSAALDDYAKTRVNLDKHVQGIEGRTPIHPEFLAAALSDHCSDDAVFCADVGMCTVWAARYLKMKKGRRLIGSFTHGSMANALPQAIGAQLQCPDREVVTLSGDGGLAMMFGELLTVVQYQLPLKVVVFNNSTLGMVKVEQNVAGMRDFGTDLQNPDFAAVARAMGIDARRVEDPADVNRSIEEALEAPGPFLLDVVTNPAELSLPPRASADQVTGYGLYLIKEVLGSGPRGVLESLRSNL